MLHTHTPHIEFGNLWLFGIYNAETYKPNKNVRGKEFQRAEGIREDVIITSKIN